MTLYICKVFELRQYAVEYVVEADDAEEAGDKVSWGDTLAERAKRFISVTERAVDEVEEAQ